VVTVGVPSFRPKDGERAAAPSDGAAVLEVSAEEKPPGAVSGCKALAASPVRGPEPDVGTLPELGNGDASA
jgi:hypothetical protein